MQKELKIFAMAKVASDMYKEKYNKADKKRKEARRDLNSNYIPGSAKFKEYKATIEPEFKAEVEKAREEILTEFEREFDELRETEIARVKTITQGSEKNMDILDRLSNIPISADEFYFLVEQYGNRNYWTDRQLMSLGTKNGIQECGVSPDITTKLGLLDQLKENLCSFIDKYRNNNSYETEVLVADATLQRLEKQYTNNYSGIRLDAREAGKRIVTEALNKLDAMERSMYLANSIRTSSPDMQEGILYELCENHSDIIGNPVMRLSGVSAAMESYKKAEYEGVKRAEKTIEKVRGEKSEWNRDCIIFSNLEDKYFLEAVEKSDDEELKKAVKHQKEVKEAGEEKEKRENPLNQNKLEQDGGNVTE